MILLALDFTVAMIVLVASPGGASPALITMLATVSITLFLVGIGAFRLHRHFGLITTRRRLRWELFAAVILSLIIVINMLSFGGGLIITLGPGQTLAVDQLGALLVLLLFVGLTFLLLALEIVFTFLGSGVIWPMNHDRQESHAPDPEKGQHFEPQSHREGEHPRIGMADGHPRRARAEQLDFDRGGRGAEIPATPVLSGLVLGDPDRYHPGDPCEPQPYPLGEPVIGGGLQHSLSALDHHSTDRPLGSRCWHCAHA